MDPISFRTIPEGQAVLSTATNALASLGYKISQVNQQGWGARAEVGSAFARVMLGGFVRRMIVDIHLTQGDLPNTATLVITPAMSGIGGGALGVSKAKKEMQSIYQTVGGSLQGAGLLAG